VAAAIEALDNARLGPSATVQGVTINPTGNMAIRLESGSAAPVIAAGETIGMFFVGTGSYTYKTADKTESVNVKAAAKRQDLTSNDSNGVITITHKFERMYVRVNAIQMPPIGTGGGSDLTAAFNEHKETMGKVRSDGTNQLLVKVKFDYPASPFAVAHFTGKGTNTGYFLDTVDERAESLLAFTRVYAIPNKLLASYWWPAIVSSQPVGRNRKDFVEPLYLLTDLDYTLDADNEENGKLNITETIAPRGKAQRTFLFNLYSTDYDSKFRARNYNVRSVTDEAGNALSYVHAKDNLIVGLPKAAAVNQPIKLKFAIDGNFLYRPAGDSRWQLGTEPWFPQPALNGQYYTVHSVVRVQKPFVAFAPGVTVRKGEEGDYNVYENRIDKPVQFAVVHAGKYSVDEKTYDDGLTIRVASYALPNALAMKTLNNLAYKMIKFYEPWLGPFPFKEFNIIEIPELGYGQAPPATMFITKEAFKPTGGGNPDDRYSSKGFNHVFAHEIAHQYWGHVVKMGSGEEQWVTEAFAEYSSALAMKQLKGQSGYNEMFAGWKARAGDSNELSSIALANRATNGLDRANILYNKGAYLLAALHKDLGDDKFLTFMRSLQGFFAWKYLTTADMARLLQRITGKDYMPFFDQYYWGTDMPTIPKS
jgi:hypothetical protein